MSRLRGNINPALIKSIFILSVVISESQLNNRLHNLRCAHRNVCEISENWKSAFDLVLIVYTNHLRQSSCAIRKFPKAYLAMLLDLNHVAQEIFATKCSSI